MHLKKEKYFSTSRELSQSIEQYMKNLPPDDTEHSVDGEKVLQAISAQHGILVERAKKIYAFAHLTFKSTILQNTSLTIHISLATQI